MLRFSFHPPLRRLLVTLSSMILLLVGISLVYFRVPEFEFLRWDDERLVTQNPLLFPPRVDQVGYLWSQPYAGVYMPLTLTFWLAEAGLAEALEPAQPPNIVPPLAPRIFHLGNSILFAGATLALFGFLMRLTPIVPAALGAGLFAMHPAQVEAVAWVSETKGLLAVFLGLIALSRYMDHARSTGASNSSAWRQATLVFAMALGAKPWSVALIPMAACLDLFFLGRSIRQIARSLGVWVLMGLAISLLASRSQQDYVRTEVPLIDRFAVAADALGHFTRLLVLPLSLGPDHGRRPDFVLQQFPYPRVVGPLVWLALAGLVRIILRLGYRRLVGCVLLFLVALAPVLGFVSFGFQEISTVADRYMLPALIAPSLALALLLERVRSIPLYLACFAGLVALGHLSFQQSLGWRSDETLTHLALRHFPKSPTFLCNRSAMHLAEGDVASALDDASASLAGSPNLIQAHFNLASALLRAGRPGDSIAALEHIAQLLPRDVRALEAITQILASQHRYADAIVHAREAYRRQGESREVRSRLARLLILAGQREEGLEHLQAALQQDLDPPKDSLAIAQVFEQAGRADEAVRMYRDMLHRAGAPAAIRRRLAWILATTDNQAVADPATALRMCLELTRGGQQGSPQELDTLAAAYARAGRYNDALVTATRAQSRAREMGDDKFARAIDARLTCYRDSRPFLVTDESAAFVRRFQQGQRAGSSQ